MLDVILFRRYTYPVGYVRIRRPYRLGVCCINEKYTPEAKM